MSMSITDALRVQALERQVGEQARRIEALETQRASTQRVQSMAPEPLKTRNATRIAKARQLHAAIEGILAASAEPDALTAKEVGKALDGEKFTPLPARRTVAAHLAQLRSNGNTRDATSGHRID